MESWKAGQCQSDRIQSHAAKPVCPPCPGNFLSAEDWNTDQPLAKTQVAFHGRKREIFAIVFPSRREEFKRPTVASVDDGFDSDQKHVRSRIALCNSCRFPYPPIFRRKIDSRDRRPGRTISAWFSSEQRSQRSDISTLNAPRNHQPTLLRPQQFQSLHFD